MWFAEMIRSISFLLDEVAYWLVEQLYSLMLLIAHHQIFETETIQLFSSRIYTILGVVMVFVLAFRLINYIINPDDFYEKEKGLGKIIVNIFVALIMIVFVPLIFNLAYSVQTIILDSDFLMKIVLGSAAEDGTFSANDFEGCSYNYIEYNTDIKNTRSSLNDRSVKIKYSNGASLYKITNYIDYTNYNYTSSKNIQMQGKDIALEVYSTNVNDSASSNQMDGGISNVNSKVISSKNITTVVKDNECPSLLVVSYIIEEDTVYIGPKPADDSDVYFKYVATDSSKGKDFVGIVFYSFARVNKLFDNVSGDELSLVKAAVEERDFDKLSDKLIKAGEKVSGEEEKKTFYLEYQIFLTTLVGFVTAFFLLSMCLDLAIRTIKLAFLQIISPIPIIAYIDPGSKKIFTNWVTESITTYIDLFIRIFLISFLIFFVGLLKDVNLGSPLLTIALIIGVLLFVQRTPKLINDMLGIDLKGDFFGTAKSSLGFIKGLGKKTYAGASLGVKGTAGMIGGRAEARSAFTDSDGNKLKGRGLAGFAGGIQGFNSGSSVKGGIFAAHASGEDTVGRHYGGRSTIEKDWLTRQVKKKTGYEENDAIRKYDKSLQVSNDLKAGKYGEASQYYNDYSKATKRITAANEDYQEAVLKYSTIAQQKMQLDHNVQVERNIVNQLNAETIRNNNIKVQLNTMKNSGTATSAQINQLQTDFDTSTNTITQLKTQKIEIDQKLVDKNVIDAKFTAEKNKMTKAKQDIIAGSTDAKDAKIKFNRKKLEHKDLKDFELKK